MAVAETPQAEPQAPQIDYDFVDINPEAQGVVDERQLMLLVKDWRKGRATRTLWDVLTDGYVAVFTLVVVAAMVISAIRAAQHQASGCTTGGCSTARELLPWLVMTGLWVALLAISRIFGPVVASAAEGFWLLDAPLRRSQLLARRLWLMVAGAGLLGAVLAALVTALTGLDTHTVIAWTIATGITGAGWIAFAAAQQGAGRTALVRLAQAIVAALAVLVLLAVIATASGWVSLAVGSGLSAPLAIVVGAVGLVLCVIAAVLARRRLDHVGRSQLVNGGELVSGMQGAAFALDFALMRDILVERRNQIRGQVKPQRGRGLGTKAIVWRDVQRLWRNPAPLIGLAVSVVVPYALNSLGLSVMSASLSALVLVAVMVPFMDSMRVLSRTKGLARLFPMSNAQLRDAVTIVPVMLTLVWALLTTPAFILPLGGQPATPAHLWYGVVAGVAGLLGAIRWVSAKSANYNAPMVSTGAGAVPPGLMFNMVRGLDIVVVVTFPLIMSWSPIVSVIIAVIAWSVLRSGGINQQEMLEASEESRKELAKMREERKSGVTQTGPARPKQVVTRSGTVPVRKRPPLRTK
nr:DUF6297 family protein [Propionibacterium cyclohexanicum]